MATYRCYCLNDDQHVFQPGVDKECTDDDEARRWARSLLALASSVPAMDLWSGKRYVGRVTRASLEVG